MRRAAAFAGALLLAACGGGGGSAPLPSGAPPTAPPGPVVQTATISSDPFTVAPGEHATEVESSAAVAGTTIVSAFQAGRFFSHGASDIAFATSRDNGTTWTHGTLPGLAKAVNPGSPFDSASDPVVAYDAMHATWLVSALEVVLSGPVVPQIDVSRSTDGLVWSAPVSISTSNADKEWIACDNGTASPHRGRCYMEWDEFGSNNAIHMAYSIDAGATWTKSASVPGYGIGGQPLIAPDGTVVVPIDDLNEQNVLAFTSHDGGVTWSNAASVSTIIDHNVVGMRAGPLISAAMDASGKIYVAWHDCRFRASCASNDVVIVTSTDDGAHWSAAARVPIDEVTSTEDHFIPIIAADTNGGAAHLAVAYYWYPVAACGSLSCQLRASIITSLDGGATWGTPQQLNLPVNLDWIAVTDQGHMVGDYNALVFANGHALPVFANALVPGSLLDEFMAAPLPGTVSISSPVRRTSHERAIPGVRRDPGRRPRPE